MDIKGKYLIILILILLTITVSISYSYFGANIIHEGEYETKVSTGLIDIKINDTSVNASNVTPIYDEDYETSPTNWKNWITIVDFISNSYEIVTNSLNPVTNQ